MIELPVLMAVPEHQKDRAAALAQYCWDLDKTHVRWIIMTKKEDEEFKADYPENRFHSLQSYGLRRAAERMQSDFIWLETDSIPLQRGWVDRLSDEYARRGKKFLLSADSHPPFDVIGGIGVYPKETEWLVPCQFPKSGWDLWLLQSVPHLIAWTPLIQHSYGIYDELGHAAEHRFPRDNKMLRGDAVLFHRDPFQDLLARK